MNNLLKKNCLIMSLLLGIMISPVFVIAQGQENYENNSLVGRIDHIEGDLLRYVPEEDDWVAAAEGC